MQKTEEHIYELFYQNSMTDVLKSAKMFLAKVFPFLFTHPIKNQVKSFKVFLRVLTLVRMSQM